MVVINLKILAKVQFKKESHQTILMIKLKISRLKSGNGVVASTHGQGCGFGGLVCLLHAVEQRLHNGKLLERLARRAGHHQRGDLPRKLGARGDQGLHDVKVAA